MAEGEIFYSVDEYGEDTVYRSIAEAVEYGYDFGLEPDEDGHVEVHEFVRMKPTLVAGDILASVLEGLNEEYGDPNGYDVSVSSKSMEQAAEEFASVVLAEYKPWACESNGVVHKVKLSEALDTSLYAGPVLPGLGREAKSG